MTQMDYGLDDDMGAETYMEDLTTYAKAMLDDWGVKLTVGGIAAFLAEWFGEDWWMIETLFCLIAADLCLGLFSALRFEGKLSGRRLHGGITKFAAYAVSIILVWLVQEITLHSLGLRLPILAVFAAYQSLTEIKSISRHLERNGMKMPSLFHRVTKGIEGKIDGKIDDILPDNGHDSEKDAQSENG